jgi:hypothetical protein
LVPAAALSWAVLVGDQAPEIRSLAADCSGKALEHTDALATGFVKWQAEQWILSTTV